MLHSISEFGRRLLASHHLYGVGRMNRLNVGPGGRRSEPWSLEALETRALLSTLLVSSAADSGPGTLRAAIEQANLDTAGDTISFAPGVTGTITLSSALPDLSTDVNLDGPGRRS